MAAELLAAAASPSTTTTAAISPASGGTTVFSLTEDDLREIFLRLPDLRALICPALTCRPWLRAVRSSRPFRRLFRDLHPAPLIGLFLDISHASAPSFLLLRRSDPIAAAALRHGDFFFTSLPPSSTGWSLADCREGYVLLWNGCPDRPCVAALNPMTWALQVLPPVPRKIEAGSRESFAVLGFHLVSSDESPRWFRVACVCADQRGVRLAVFLSETWEWVIRPWMIIGGDCSLKFMAGTLVDRFVFWPYHGEAQMVVIDTATMDICTVDLPPQVEVAGHNFGIGETSNGELCVVYVSDFFLHVWIRRPAVDGIEIWGPASILSLGAEIHRFTHAFLDVQLRLKIVQVRSGLVHLMTRCITHAGTLHSWFFSLPLETMELELLLEGSFDGVAHLYTMAWPTSLVGDDD